MELHVDMPRAFLQEGANILLLCYLRETAVFLNGNAALVELAASEAKVATADLDLLAEHTRPQELTFVRTKLAFSESSQLQYRKNTKSILYLNVLIVIDTAIVSAAADYTQPLALNFPLADFLLLFYCFL